MKSFDTELTKYTKKTRLAAAEKAELRARISTYMEYHPLPKDMQVTAAQTPVLERAEAYARIAFVWAREQSHHTYARVGAAAFVVVLMISSLPFAAEKTVPGDVLYPIKTNFNETLLAQFANSPYEKVNFETELMERRIAEARLLAKTGKLTDDVEASIAADVREHANAAQEGIAALKVSDADEAAIAEITFGSALEVQTAVLDSDREDAEGASAKMAFAVTAENANDIASVVRQVKANADAAKSIDVPSYDKLHSRVEEEVARAYDLFGSLKSDVNDEERGDIERRLGDIERKIIEAENIHASDVSGDGAPELVEALSAVQKVISFMTDIDVRENVDIEELVPLTLTFDERMNTAVGTIDGAKTRMDALKARASTTDNADIKLKISEGAVTLDTLLERASTSRATKDVSALESIAAEVQALMAEIEAAVGNDGPVSQETMDADVETERSTTTASVIEIREG